MKIKFIRYFIIGITNLFLSIGVQAQSSAECGKLLNSLVKYDPASKKVSFEKFFFTQESFCDLGTNEINANFELNLFDKNKVLLNMKSVYLNTSTVGELLKPKTSLFLKNKIIITPQYRNIKFSILVGQESIASYKVYSKIDHKLFGEGAVK